MLGQQREVGPRDFLEFLDAYLVGSLKERGRGVELAGGWLPADGLRARASLTLLNATYEDSFLTCAGIPCTVPTLAVPAGNRVAGTQRRAGYAELGWRKAGHGELAAEVRGSGRTAVNDANSDFAGGYGTASLRWISAGVPSASLRPWSITTIRSAIAMMRSM